MEEFKKRFETIRDDVRSGATTILLDTLGLFEEVLEKCETSDVFFNLNHFSDALIKAHPTMAQVINLCRDVIEAPENLRDLRDLVRGWHELVRKQTHAVTATAARRCDCFNRIITLSNSKQVADAIGAMRGVTDVVLSESRPMNEGLIMARYLFERGKRVTVTVDAALPGMIEPMDAVMVGCDCLTHDFFVNKVGTYPLAMACRDKGIPLFVLCPSCKFLSRERHLYYRILDHAAQGLGYNLISGIDVRNRFFEPVPNSLIREVIWEEGADSPERFLESRRQATYA